MKILFCDIETSPHIVHTWGLFEQTVSIEQIVEPSHILCWGAKFYENSQMHFASLNTHSKRTMLNKLHKLLDECDVLVTYNGSTFDVPIINSEFLQLGMKPPSPYKHIDIYSTIKTRFRFASNKLAFISKTLEIGRKTPHEGHSLWVKCMAGDKSALARMKKYNCNDVILLEKLYLQVKPWIKSHPNYGLYLDENRPVCTNCGSTKIQRRGYAYTTIQTYPRFVCMSCGKWMRGKKTEKNKNKNQLIGL